jgi:hypothetical protein
MAWSHDGRSLGAAAGTTAGLTVALDPPTGWITPYARAGPGGVGSMVAVAWAVLLASVVARQAFAVARTRRQGCGASGPQAA